MEVDGFYGRLKNDWLVRSEGMETTRNAVGCEGWCVWGASFEPREARGVRVVQRSQEVLFICFSSNTTSILQGCPKSKSVTTRLPQTNISTPQTWIRLLWTFPSKQSIYSGFFFVRRNLRINSTRGLGIASHILSISEAHSCPGSNIFQYIAQSSDQHAQPSLYCSCRAQQHS